MLKPYLARVADGGSLTRSEAREAMQLIMQGQATAAQIAGFLVALRAKSETTEELIGFAEGMRACALKLEHDLPGVIDTCGTGGDGRGTLNISTAAALVAAAAGARVAKHGNRSVSSRCGSADLLERWGVRLDLPAARAAEALKRHGITFLFAPNYHPAMKHAAGPRREMGLRTVFNLLGPLTNPAGVARQVVGVFDRRWIEPLAETLLALKAERALIVASRDGLDEISHAAVTEVAEVRLGGVHTYTIEPEQLGLSGGRLEDIAGGDPEANAARLGSVLRGDADKAAAAVAVNAGAALYVAGLADSIASGTAQAEDTLKSGAAWIRLEAWARWTQEQT